MRSIFQTKKSWSSVEGMHVHWLHWQVLCGHLFLSTWLSQ